MNSRRRRLPVLAARSAFRGEPKPQEVPMTTLT
jgi:hypothetical protein